MCLAVPGRIITVSEACGHNGCQRTASVSFGGIAKEISLAFTPDAKAGDFVIVHAGFALNTVDEQEARRQLELLDAMDALAGSGPLECPP